MFIKFEFLYIIMFGCAYISYYYYYYKLYLSSSLLLYCFTASFSFSLSLAAFQLLNGRVEDDEIPEEYCGLEGSNVLEQLTIVSSRLDQREADYDSLKTELNKTKEECINLQGH